MASNKNSSSNRVEVPEARDAMDRFKMEVANELGVNLKRRYYCKRCRLHRRRNGS